MSESVSSSEHYGETQGPLPLGMACPGCGYDVSGAPVWRCSECGREVTIQDAQAFELRRGAEAAAYQLALRQFIGGIVVALVMGLGVLFLHLEWGPALAAFAVCWVASMLSIGAGWVVAGLSPQHERWGWRLAWLRTHWVLHVPWLCIAVCAVLLFSVGMAVHLLGTLDAASVVLAMAAMGLLIWLIVGLGVLLQFLERWIHERRRLGLEHVRTELALSLLSVAVLLCAGMLGFAGGIVAVGGTMRWIDPSMLVGP